MNIPFKIRQGGWSNREIIIYKYVSEYGVTTEARATSLSLSSLRAEPIESMRNFEILEVVNGWSKNEIKESGCEASDLKKQERIVYKNIQKKRDKNRIVMIEVRYTMIIEQTTDTLNMEA
ncbi:hypothetical protein PPL_08070 [Heterostelium album PN500]|uniref:Uncharacterized protein n=1 Tax=Heterostelium pallidum (strain ATCC 26659 / Pp 5 / PN500) TaxID=670386 RepID=D3BIJ1_HETP5|nr:hypothetical protein PPL_08070 [Heterostelium album PN500]EFA78615.1 hypothetical protein PPL_08070 [Heterostelium album PN500]|eukprot:XP_020430739.1 hypothetical protein PPL_08070 [Heterostelium album PN500]